MQHILVATDGSSGAERAMEVAAQLAKAIGAQLSIPTVDGNLTADEMRQLERAEGSLGDALEGLSKQILWHAAECAKRVGVSTAGLQAETTMKVVEISGSRIYDGSRKRWCARPRT